MEILNDDTNNESGRPKIERWLETHRFKIGFLMVLALITGSIVYLFQSGPNLIKDNGELTNNQASLMQEIKTVRQENESIKTQIQDLNQKLSEFKNEVNGLQIGNESVSNGQSSVQGKVAGASSTVSQKTSSQSQSSVIDINNASSAELEKLPGVGPSRAEAIIQYRNANGGFKTIEEIMNIRGIGEKTFEKMKGMITVK